MPERNLHFDEVIPRKGTDCLKYDFALRRGMPEDVLPLWVADMDFKTSSYIEDAVIERTKHAIFGYSEVQQEFINSIEDGGWETVMNAIRSSDELIEGFPEIINEDKLRKILMSVCLEVDEFDSRLNQLLKDFIYLPQEDVAECLSFYLDVIKKKMKEN